MQVSEAVLIVKKRLFDLAYLTLFEIISRAILCNYNFTGKE